MITENNATILTLTLKKKVAINLTHRATKSQKLTSTTKQLMTINLPRKMRNQQSPKRPMSPANALNNHYKKHQKSKKNKIQKRNGLSRWFMYWPSNNNAKRLTKIYRARHHWLVRGAKLKRELKHEGDNSKETWNKKIMMIFSSITYQIISLKNVPNHLLPMEQKKEN